MSLQVLSAALRRMTPFNFSLARDISGCRRGLMNSTDSHNYSHTTAALAWAKEESLSASSSSRLFWDTYIIEQIDADENKKEVEVDISLLGLTDLQDEDFIYPI